jgi:hypothetical protein
MCSNIEHFDTGNTSPWPPRAASLVEATAAGNGIYDAGSKMTDMTVESISTRELFTRHTILHSCSSSVYIAKQLVWKVKHVLKAQSDCASTSQADMPQQFISNKHCSMSYGIKLLHKQLLTVCLCH